VQPPLGRTARPRLMTHASARIHQSSCHSRLLSAAGLPRRPTTHTMESLSSGSPHLTSQAGLVAQVTSPWPARATAWPVSTYLPTQGAAKPTHRATGPGSSAGSRPTGPASPPRPAAECSLSPTAICMWGRMPLPSPRAIVSCSETATSFGERRADSLCAGSGCDQQVQQDAGLERVQVAGAEKPARQQVCL
jgi:hypothetical protein